MEKSELKEALSEIRDDIKAKVDELKTANDQKADTLNKEIEALKTNAKELQDAFDGLQTSFEKRTKEPSQRDKDFVTDLREKLQAEIANFKTKGTKSEMEVKSFLESNTASITTGSELPAALIESGINKAPDSGLHLYQILPRVPVGNGRIVWTERKTRTDNSEFTAEGTATASESVLGYKTVEATFVKLSDFIKVSRESIDDIDWILNEVRTELITLLELKLDGWLLDGTTSDDSNSFNGLEYYAQAFAPGYTCEPGVTPNEFDVISAAANQVTQSHFKPTHCLVSVKKYGQMKVLRDNNGQYLYPWFAQNGLLTIDGVTIVPNTDVDDDDFLTIDSSKAKILVRKGMSVEVYDQNENDALADLRTVRASGRVYLQVKGNDTNAFVKGTFTAAKSTITNDAQN